MEREATGDRDRHDQDRDRVANAGADDIGTDDEEFASLEDVGREPGENPAVDDV